MDVAGTRRDGDEWGFASPWSEPPTTWRGQGDGRARAGEDLSWVEEPADVGTWDAADPELPVEEFGAPEDRAPVAPEEGHGDADDAELEDFATEMLEDESLAAEDGEGAAAEAASFPTGLVLPPATTHWPRGSEHWDPHDAGVPLYVIDPSSWGERLAPRFTVKELASSGGRTAAMARISGELVRLLQQIRDAVGRPVRITSGYRSWARNQAIYEARGKKPTLSRHCSGQAADIKAAGMTGIQLAKVAIDVGGPDLALGIGKDYLHVDVRGRWTVWTYLAGNDDAAARALANDYRSRAGSGAPGGGGPVTPTPNRQRGVVPYQTAKGCQLDENGDVVHQPGAQACAQQWRRITDRKAGTGSCRRIAHDATKGWSVHGEGRAIDAYADADDPVQKAQADAYVAWLQKNAVELQVTYLIWDAQQWTWNKRDQGWRRYPARPTGRESKTRLHRDHIHIEITWEGCRSPSRLWSGPVAGWPG